MITAEELREIVNYNPDTGELRRIKKTSRSAGVGKVMGAKNSSGYLVCTIHKKSYYVHRLAWLYMTGDWPHEIIDHVNRDKTDNRWRNLRAASYSQNGANRIASSNNACGAKGVRQGSRNRWRAQIGIKGIYYNLGSFDTVEAAEAAYQNAAKRHFGEFAK